jgi:sulfide:quinone oxidoreductase
MDNKYIEKMLSKMDEDLSKQGMSRRDAMKMAGITGAGMFMGGATSAAAAEEEKVVKSNAKGRSSSLVVVLQV